jgi:predicted transcriptional regulator
MKTGLLSIHDKYARRIFAGTKRFEFRRRAPDVQLPTRFLVYVPGRRRLVGEITVDAILRGSPTQVWETTKPYAGITRREYRQYFQGRQEACALAIQSYKEYDDQACLDTLRAKVPGGFYPPQYLRWIQPDLVALMRPASVTG